MTQESGALQVGDDTAGNTHDVHWCSTKVVVPRSGGSPHLVVLQQVRIYEHAQLSAVTKGRYIAIGSGNPSSHVPLTWHYGHVSEYPDNDPVIISVAAYSANPIAYEAKYATHLLDRPTRFASLLSPGSHILDLGCGPGRDIRIFSEGGHKPIGIDLNPAFIEMASRQGDVIQGDIRNIGSTFTPATFDGVWAQASLVHLERSEISVVLRDLQDLLKPNGLLYACVPATGETGWLEESDGRRWYTTWPEDSFETAVRATGFHINDVTHGPYVEVWATKV